MTSAMSEGRGTAIGSLRARRAEAWCVRAPRSARAVGTRARCAEKQGDGLALAWDVERQDDRLRRQPEVPRRSRDRGCCALAAPFVAEVGVLRHCTIRKLHEVLALHAGFRRTTEAGVAIT